MAVPSLGVTIRPAGWDVLHPLDGPHIAVVRLVLLGPHRDPFYRVVTPERGRSQRRLLGYWATLELSHEAALALYERATGSAIEGGGRPPSRIVPEASTSHAPRGSRGPPFCELASSWPRQPRYRAVE